MELSFLEALTLIFVFSKLFGVIDWSWVWVFSPIWGLFGLAIINVILEVFTDDDNYH